MSRTPPPDDLSHYQHQDRRLNNPDAGSVRPDTDPDLEVEVAEWSREPHDPHLDPHLGMCYAGKSDEPMRVETRSLHIHEHISPTACIENVKKSRAAGGQPALFGPDRLPAEKAIEFYQHSVGWENRMIAGDSLLVMNSLLEREQMGGKVQTIYFDPPYGMNYNSNFQPFTHDKNVTDKDLTQEPEMVKAFRDTWELGIHSYLSYMRDRLHLCRELLTEEGSIFVQMGDENFARVCLLLDEVFGAENRVTMITYVTTGGSSAETLPDVCSYLLWYAKDKENLKFHQVYENLDRRGIIDHFGWSCFMEFPDGTTRKLSDDEKLNPEIIPDKAHLFRRMRMTSQGWSNTGRSEPYEYNGRTFNCHENRQWSVSMEGMDRLAELGRLDDINGAANSLEWKWYEDEVPGRRLNNVWHKQMSATNKKYVVETAKSVIQRCILMTSDPGDLILDPTCGSGTTAYVAEQWGRRWITCDTSRVALTLARQRLTTSVFPYYTLADPEGEDISQGFNYKTVPYVSAKTLAYDEPQTYTTLYDQPDEDKKRHRVCGPFTMEALPPPLGPPQVSPVEQPEEALPEGNDDWQSMLLDKLVRTGIRGHNNGNIVFASIEKYPNPDLHAIGELVDGKQATICFGPKHSSLSKTAVELGIQEAQTLVPEPEVIFFVAQQFAPEAQTAIDTKTWGSKDLRRAVIDPDIFMQDLKGANSKTDTPFWLVGQPDIALASTDDGRNILEITGFDYFDPAKGTCITGGAEKVAVWLLDTNYDGRTLRPSQIFFPANNGWDKLAKELKAVIAPDLIAAYKGSTSLPFPTGEYGRAAVKVVDNRGVESMRILSLPNAER